MNRIAIIPARSGSKRIPDKNLLKLGGRTLLKWSIDVAIDSNLFDRVLVSTDSQKYANLAIEYGGDAPFLRDAAIDDYSPISHATVRALEQAKDHYGQDFQTVVQLMPNCPLRTTNTVKSLVYYFEKEQPSSLISCFKYGWMNPNWAFIIDSEGVPRPIFPEKLKKRSQDLPNLYCPSGAVWISSNQVLMSNKNFYSKGWKCKEIPWQEAIDIDDYSDLAMAKALMLLKEEYPKTLE